MESENETVAEIANEMRGEWAQVYFSESSRRNDGEYCDAEFAAVKPGTVADRIEAAHRRELADFEATKTALANVITEKKQFAEIAAQLERDVDELRETIDANLRVHTAAEKADADKKLELMSEIVRRDATIAELCECLEQAYGDKIGTYTMKGNEVAMWRKALEGAKDEENNS